MSTGKHVGSRSVKRSTEAEGKLSVIEFLNRDHSMSWKKTHDPGSKGYSNIKLSRHVEGNWLEVRASEVSDKCSKKVYIVLYDDEVIALRNYLNETYPN